MTKHEENAKVYQLSALNSEINRVMAVLKENIKKNTTFFRKADHDQKNTYADFIKEDNRQLQILENAKDKGQTNTLEVQSILQRYKKPSELQSQALQAPQLTTTSKEAPSKPSYHIKESLRRWMGASNTAATKNQTKQAFPLEEKINIALQRAQTELDNLTDSVQKLASMKQIYDPTGQIAKKIKESVDKQVSIADDMAKLRDYKGEQDNKHVIIAICGKYNEKNAETARIETQTRPR